MRRAPSPEGAPKNRQLKNHHSYNNYNPILFQYINIRHLLGMYITKQAEQEIYLIAKKKSYDSAPPKTNIHSTSQARRGCPFLSQWPDEL